MITISWFQQDETTDEDGFFLQPPAVYEAERKILAEAGCPHTDQIEFLSHEIEDRDSAIIEAKVPDETAEWIGNEAWGTMD